MMQGYISHQRPSSKLGLESTDELCDKQGLKRTWRSSKTNVSIQGTIELVNRSELVLL